VSKATVVSGDGQVGEAGTQLSAPLVARITNASGQVLVGYVVNFVVTGGGGTVFAGSAMSDSDGLVRERWTVGTTAGPQTLEVRAVDGSGNPVVFETFHATSIAGPAVLFEDVQGSGTQAGIQGQPLSRPVRVIVKDIYGNPRPNTPLTFTACATCGTVSNATPLTDANGIGQFEWTLGIPLGHQSVMLSIGGVDKWSFDANSLQAPPGAPVVVVARAGDGQSVVQHHALAQPLLVFVADALGNGVPGVAVDASLAVGGSFQALGVTTTNAVGVAEFTPMLHTTGSQTVRLSVPGLTPVDFSVAVTASAFPLDGTYQCTSNFPPATTSGTFTMIFDQGQLQGIDNSPTSRTFYTATFDLVTGNFTGSRRSSLNATEHFTGVFSADANGNATATGTFQHVFAAGTLDGVWGCARN
jgi:hypothetical protein